MRTEKVLVTEFRKHTSPCCSELYQRNCPGAPALIIRINYSNLQSQAIVRQYIDTVYMTQIILTFCINNLYCIVAALQKAHR